MNLGEFINALLEHGLIVLGSLDIDWWVEFRPSALPEIRIRYITPRYITPRTPINKAFGPEPRRYVEWIIGVPMIQEWLHFPGGEAIAKRYIDQSLRDFKKEVLALHPEKETSASQY